MNTIIKRTSRKGKLQVFKALTNDFQKIQIVNNSIENHIYKKHKHNYDKILNKITTFQNNKMYDVLYYLRKLKYLNFTSSDELRQS